MARSSSNPLGAFLGSSGGGRLKQVLHFSAELAMTMFWIGLVLCVVAIAGDAIESAWAIHSFFNWVNPLGGMMLWVGWTLGGLDGIGAIWFVMYHYFRGSGFHETEEYQQTADIHAFDKQQVVHDAVNTWMSQYLTGMGLIFLIFIVGTDIVGLFSGEWAGFTFAGYSAHGVALVGNFDTSKFTIALIVNIIIAGIQFGWSTLGIILCFHYREWAKGRVRREERVIGHANAVAVSPVRGGGSGNSSGAVGQRSPQIGSGSGRAAIPQRSSASAGGQGSAMHMPPMPKKPAASISLAQTHRLSAGYEDEEDY